MSKISRNYMIIWAVMLALFNLIVFIAPGWKGLAKYTGAFWVAYAVTTLVFVINLLVTLWAFKDSEKSREKLFLNIPIIRISYFSLVVTIVVGAFCMLNSLLPTWVACVLMGVLMLIYVFSAVKANMAAEVVYETSQKIQADTNVIKLLRADADSLVTKATPATRDICSKIADALKYSDPVSNDTCAPVEIEMRAKFDEFAAAVKVGEDDKAGALGNELLDLIDERNKKCRVGK